MNPEKYNKLLYKQIQKYFGNHSILSPELDGFLNIISETYDHFEKDRKMRERSIDVISNEMIDLNTQLKNEAEKLKIAYDQIKSLNTENEEKLRLINKNSPDIILTVKFDGSISYINKPIKGKHPSELVGTDFSHLLTQKLTNEFSFKFQEALNSKPQNFEISTDIFEAENNFYNVRINNFISEKNDLSNLIIFSNINASKQAEFIARENQNLINEIYNVLVDAILIIDENGFIKKWDQKCEKLFGWKEDEVIDTLLNDSIIRHVYRQMHVKGMDKFLQIENHNSYGNTMDLKAIHKNGKKFDISLSMAVSTISGQKHFIGFIRDVSERKKIEAELLDQKEFIDEILNNIPADIAVFDKNHNYLFINKTGIKDEALRKWMINKNDFDYCKRKKISEDSAIERRNLFTRALNQKNEVEWIDEYNVLSPKKQYVLRKFHPVIEKEEIKFIVGYGVDITELKVKEEDLNKTLFILNNKLNDLMQFNYIVSHNLRAPIANILALCDLMTLEEVPEAEKIKAIELIKESTNKIDDLIFDLNSILENRLSLNVSKEKINIESLLNNTKSLLENPLVKSNSLITIKVEKDARELNGIKTYFESIFYNIISNAIKYKSTFRNLELQIQVKKIDKNIVIMFMDNGRGIDLSTHKENIFGLYKRFHFDVEGKGLGLHMTKNQIEAMDGTIEIESEIEKGTTFILKFPI